ncbi:MAG: hypothetical protein V1690_03375 [Candidatus Moraniibacteriota bacterium]
MTQKTMVDFPSPIAPKPTLPSTDFSKITNAAPLQAQQQSDVPERQAPTRIDDPNQERREDRVKRENLLRYYEAEFNNGKRELTVVNKDLSELENLIRNEEKEIDILETDQAELKIKLARIEKSLHRFKFELRVHKGDQMEKRIVQRRWQETVRESEAKLKKIKYGDWKALRR